MLSKLKNNKGFTIVEMIAVLVIISIVVGMAQPKFVGMRENNEVSSMKSDTKSLSNAIIKYKIDSDSWPILEVNNSEVQEGEIDADLLVILNGSKVEHIKKDFHNKYSVHLNEDISNYGLITSRNKYQGQVIHLLGVEDRDGVLHYSEDLNINSKKIVQYGPEESAPIEPVDPESPVDPDTPVNPPIIPEYDGVKFFGETSVEDLITGDELASRLSLNEGTSQNSNEGWLKFTVDSKVVYIAKKPLRSHISWNSIENVGAVSGDGKSTGGTAEVVIDNNTYRVRLLRGLIEGTSDIYTGENNYGSEWNRLMLPIHERSIDSDWTNPGNVESNIWSISHNYGSGINGLYTDYDLMTQHNYGAGTASWVQDLAADGTNRVLRGSAGVSGSTNAFPTDPSYHHGWRPVLELIQ